MTREKIFSLTREDFEWDYFRAGGKGGQAQNKTSSGVRVRHRPSGAVAECREERDQLANRRRAFKRITEDPKFRLWLRITAAKINGIATPEEVVETQMAEKNLKIEVRNKGKWETQ